MIVSPIGRAWTAHSERCSLTAYPDNGAYSIGYGHRGVPEGTVWSQAQAEAALDHDLEGAQASARMLVGVELVQGQFDALTDFVYNLGTEKLAKSTLLKLLNAGNYEGACRELYWEDEDGHPHGWIYAEGEISPGLIARRKGEQILWNGGNPL